MPKFKIKQTPIERPPKELMVPKPIVAITQVAILLQRREAARHNKAKRSK